LLLSRDDEWILDTDASFHNCFNKNWFRLYEFLQTEDFVHVRDDTPCHIVSIRSIQIRTHDRMTYMLTGVKQIPTMARNFMSLGTMDCKGYKYKGGNKVLKVSKLRLSSSHDRLYEFCKIIYS
jgi:hypothetical protein